MTSAGTADQDLIQGSAIRSRRVLTVKGFCREYEISRAKAYIEIREGRLQIRKAGTRTLIAREAAEAWFESLPKC